MSFHIGQFLQLIQGQIDLGTARVGLFRATVSEVDGPNRKVRLIRDGSTEAEDEWRQVIVGSMPVVGDRVNCLPYHAPRGQTPPIAVVGTAEAGATGNDIIIDQTYTTTATSSTDTVNNATHLTKSLVLPSGTYNITTSFDAALHSRPPGSASQRA